MLQAPPPQMTVLSSQAMPYPVTYQPQPGSVPPQMLPGNDYADLGKRSRLVRTFPVHAQSNRGWCGVARHQLIPDPTLLLAFPW